MFKTLRSRFGLSALDKSYCYIKLKTKTSTNVRVEPIALVIGV